MSAALQPTCIAKDFELVEIQHAAATRKLDADTVANDTFTILAAMQREDVVGPSLGDFCLADHTGALVAGAVVLRHTHNKALIVTGICAGVCLPCAVAARKEAAGAIVAFPEKSVRL